jgi:plastocyanin
MREVGRPWITGAAVVLSVVALTGCAPAAPPADARAAPAAVARPRTTAGSTTTAAGGADCTRATKVAIVDHGSGYAFSPADRRIQRGAFLAVTNRSSAVHPLSAPDTGMVTSIIGPRERQVIQFPEAGTFAVRTGDAVLHLTVAGESGCGSPEPTLTITGAGTFTPATARVTATENFAVVNRSGVTQSVRCTPGTDQDHTRLDAGETQILALDEPGRYVCAGLRHPAAKVTITVTS